MGNLTRKDEVHEERTYPIDDYLARLATAGFKEAMVCADFTDEAPSEESARWFFVCKKIIEKIFLSVTDRFF